MNPAMQAQMLAQMQAQGAPPAMIDQMKQQMGMSGMPGMPGGMPGVPPAPGAMPGMRGVPPAPGAMPGMPGDVPAFTGGMSDTGTDQGYINSNPAWKALLSWYPDASKHVDPAGIKAVWTDDKFKTRIEDCTADMENSVPRARCQGAVDVQNAIIRLKKMEIGGHQSEITPFESCGTTSNQSLEARLEAVQSKVLAYERPHEIAKDKQGKAVALKEKEEAKMAALQEDLATAEQALKAALAGDGPDPADLLASAESSKQEADAAVADAKKATADATQRQKDCSASKLEAKKAVTTAKTVKTKADAEVKKGKGDAAELQAAADEASRVFAEAEEKLSASEEEEKAAKEGVVQAKAEEKGAGDALKAAVKAVADAKKDLSGTSNVQKKLETTVTQCKTKVDNQQKKLDKCDKDIEGPQKILDETAGTVAALEELRAGLKAHVAAHEAAIEAATAEIQRICSEARGPEMSDLMASYQKARDDLLTEMAVPWAHVAVIEQLRKDRVATHGQAELDRRVSEQKRIVALKEAENKRRDGIMRTCLLCDKQVGGRSAANRHGDLSDMKNIECSKCVSWVHANLVSTHPVAFSDCPQPKFKSPEPVGHLSLVPPHLDSALWGTVEKKKDNELVLYSFETDIVTNPYDGWHAGFKGAYNSNFVQQDPSNGAPIADDAVKALPANLQPKPATRDVSIYTTKGNWEKTKSAYTRTTLHIGNEPKEGDRYLFLTREHDFWKNHCSTLAPANV